MILLHINNDLEVQRYYALGFRPTPEKELEISTGENPNHVHELPPSIILPQIIEVENNNATIKEQLPRIVNSTRQRRKRVVREEDNHYWLFFVSFFGTIIFAILHYGNENGIITNTGQ